MKIDGFLNTNPFIRIIIPFILGIIICYHWHAPLLIVYISIFYTFILISILIYKKKVEYKHQCIPCLLISGSIVVLGYLTLYLNTKNVINAILNQQECEYRAIVTNPPIEKAKCYKVDLITEAINIDGEWAPLNKKLSCTLMKDSTASMLKAGQTIVFKTVIDTLKAPKNPFGFDYSSYLAKNGIQGSIYLRSNEWEIADNKTKGVKQHALNVRQTLVMQLKKVGLEGNELGLASTLVLGYKNNIDAEIKQAYMSAGAMHVLAVSGMHVGIIFIVLNTITSLFIKKQFFRLKHLIIIVALWTYAFITGLSPSVMRATVMFTFVLIGKMVNKNISIYNSLAASAFFLLLYNPQLLFNAGFQLSYAAVIGIVFFQPRIVNLIPKAQNNKITKYIWELTAVSIAAQIATFPFCIYYFERTPTYFWLSNIIVSPGAAIMIFLTLLLLITSPFTCITKVIGYITSFFARLMNNSVRFIANLPNSTIDNPTISVFQCIMIATIIIGITVWTISNNHRYLLYILTSVLGIILPYSVQRFKHSNTLALCIYHDTQNSTIQFVNGRQSHWICINNNDTIKSKTLIKGGNSFWTTSKHTLIDNDTTHYNANLAIDKQFFTFGNSKGVIVSNKTELFNASDTMVFDFLIVSGKPQIKAQQIPSNIIFKNVIIDASVPPWIAKSWENKYNGSHIHNVERQGAYIAQWQL